MNLQEKIVVYPLQLQVTINKRPVLLLPIPREASPVIPDWMLSFVDKPCFTKRGLLPSTTEENRSVPDQRSGCGWIAIRAKGWHHFNILFFIRDTWPCLFFTISMIRCAVGAGHSGQHCCSSERVSRTTSNSDNCWVGWLRTVISRCRMPCGNRF